MARKMPKEGTKAYEDWLRRRLARKCLVLWREACWLRCQKKCEACGAEHGVKNEKGKPQYLNAHHIEDKTNWATRFDPMNGIMLCPKCHKYGRDSAHMSPLWLFGILRELSVEYVPGKFFPGPDRLARLIIERMDYRNNSDWDIPMLQKQERHLSTIISKWKERK